MSEIQERRAEGAGRVRVETLVEVCGNEPGVPAFEAEAVDVSARGMHLRTAYLPDSGAPLVCRFQEGGREIVVEGRVAWRREGSRGGEFGVEFTALDSSSVGALRELCDGASEHEAAPEAHHDARSQVGSRVRLHIDGLGSPMKARVRESGNRNVQVGSNLEFLKVGRQLEVEDLEAGGRRVAQIDGVSVAIDPQTRVPQLVVQLRFAGAEDTTPEPSVTALHGSDAGKGFKIPGGSVTTDAAAPARDNHADDSDEEYDDEDAAALRGKIGEAAANAGEAVQTAGAAVARFSARAAQGMGGLFKGAGRKVLELSKRAEPPPQRRTTAPAPNGHRGVEGQRLRPQSSANVSEEAAPSASKSAPRKKLMLGAGAVVLVASGAALATHFATTASSPPGAHTASAAAVATLAPPSTGAPLSLTPPGMAPASNGVASANIPLFGPTPMATMEPAPLAPPPGSPEAVEAQERADARSNLSATPVSSAAADEAFSDEGSDDDRPDAKSSKDEKSKSEKSDKTDTTPWGHGKLRSPTIYRLRLDAPGGKLQGALLPTGFTVLVPNHKVMEQGTSIAKRDNRISSVRTSNRTEGAEVSFRFRDSIPAYRVRLRRDYMEILIGEGESKDAKEAKDKSSKEAKDKSSKSDSKPTAHGKSHKG